MDISETFLNLVHKCPPHLREQMTPIRLKRGAFLLKEGDHNDYVYLLLSGSVQTYHYTDNGELFVSYINTQGRYIFGDIEAIRDTYAPILRNVIALEDSQFLKVSRAVFLQWLREDGDFSLYLLRSLCENTLHSTEYAITNARQSLKKRCAILLCANHDSNGRVNFGKDTLSGILVTSLRSTNRILKELRESGIISTQGKTIYITDLQQLQKLAE